MLRVAGRAMFQGRSSQSLSIERPPMRVRTSRRYALGSISLGFAVANKRMPETDLSIV